MNKQEFIRFLNENCEEVNDWYIGRDTVWSIILDKESRISRTAPNAIITITSKCVSIAYKDEYITVFDLMTQDGSICFQKAANEINKIINA